MYAVEYSAAIQNDNMYLLSGKMFIKCYHKKRRLKKKKAINSMDNMTAFLSKEKNLYLCV